MRKEAAYHRSTSPRQVYLKRCERREGAEVYLCEAIELVFVSGLQLCYGETESFLVTRTRKSVAFCT